MTGKNCKKTPPKDMPKYMPAQHGPVPKGKGKKGK